MLVGDLLAMDEDARSVRSDTAAHKVFAICLQQKWADLLSGDFVPSLLTVSRVPSVGHFLFLLEGGVPYCSI